MLEKVYKVTGGDNKVIEIVINDENVHYNHMILPAGQGLPLHRTNSNVYMFVVRGTLTISLADNPAQVYEKGTIINIPNGIEMNARNEHSEVLELTVVKAPAPQRPVQMSK
ncbi:MAG: Cupin domain protein [Firmicutes bacterium ADurb.Bin080]|jgi:quercetin dioxygenase-like cupin family protein|nr:cupin domain-containing protein [Clostridiales bacterium]OQC11910.1 MAG: Cupin domain protein [Firmicutes bacterium ADurb.Bin080]